MELIDAHAHLTDEKFDDLQAVLTRAKEHYVEKIICSAFNLPSSQSALELAKTHSNIFANVGLHPENVDELDEKTLKNLEKLAKNEKVVAIGEIGLDYHFREDNKSLQKQVFVEQIKLAKNLQKPIVVHSRDAMGDTIDILKSNRHTQESLMHCYAGSFESAKILMDLGFSFSFGGVATFKNAKNVVEVIKNLPLERILLETDCPYMSPEPFRGKRNEPKNIIYVADKIASIKGLSLEEVAFQTTENAKRIFKI